METPEIFLSYSWEDEGPEVADALDAFFQGKGITVVRDSRAIGYKGLLSEYITRLGRGKAVVVVLSDAYFKSKRCMSELMLLAKHKDVYDRIFPVMVEGLNIDEAEQMLHYVTYWETKTERLDQGIRTTKTLAHQQGIRDDLDRYVEIRQQLPTLMNFLRNINARPLHGKHFEPLYHAIQARIQQDAQPGPAPQSADGDTPDVADPGPHPYKGLAAFQDTDAEWFFGRERVIQVLWETLCALYERPVDGPAPLRLLAILGPSGCGKSSVARAGLLPELVKHPLPGKQNACVVAFIPGAHPLDALALSLARIDTSPQTLATTTSEFTKVLKQEADGQCEGLRRIVDTLPEIDTRPLILLVDQFEEIYAKEVTFGERLQFLDNLLCAAADPSGRVSVILTLRSDFLGQTQSHPTFNQVLARQHEIIPVMNDAELRDAIAKPAEHAGHALDAATVDRLLEQTRDREGALPLLQFALTRIWDGLIERVSPTDTLKAIGGVGGALAGEAQRLFDSLSEGNQAIARRGFLALVQLGEGTRDTCRRISLTTIVAHGEDAAHVQTVIRYFANPHIRLVMLSATPDGMETAEMTHEALLDHWETLREWLDVNREDLRFRRRLAAAASYWDKRDNADGLLWRSPDLDLLRQYQAHAGADMTPLQVEFFNASTRKEWYSRWTRRIMVAFIMLTIFATGAAGLIWRAYNDANTQKAAAIHQSHISLIRLLVVYSFQDETREQRERAALLARQAFLLNQRIGGGVDTQIEDALRTIFRTTAIQEGLGRDATGTALADLVCQGVGIKKALTPDEWVQFVGNGIDYEPACPQLHVTQSIQLRTESMAASDVEALSLNLRQERGYGYPIVFIANAFEELGEVIVDHATGLMWQKFGSPHSMSYADAQEYIKQLNRERFAGYNDWRLPTVEELLSLIEEKKQSNELYIDPIFERKQSWCWSADKRRSNNGSPESTWYVHFDFGNVYGFSPISHYVRGVRS